MGTMTQRTGRDGPIHLDHNATTPVAPEVAEAMWPYLTEHHGNPSSSTPAGALARAAVDGAREQVAAIVDAHPDEIVFTSGGTEDNNLAIRGSAAVATYHAALTSTVEHPATVAPLAHLRDQGWRVHELPVDAECRAIVDDAPTVPVGLGTLILAHNETGAIQPAAEFAERVHAAGGVAHADAAQAVGKVPVSVEDLGVDLLSIAGHKLYAPKGVGALYVRRGTTLAPVLRGAGQEGGLRPGTENVPGIVGLGAAAELAGGLLDADVLADATGLAASTGSACHSGVHSPSAALVAMGIDHDTALGALRLSPGRSTTRTDLERAADLVTVAATG